jgi:hypothetical protein
MIRGVVGQIRWHRYPAASINGFTVTPLRKDRSRWSLLATVVLSNSFNLAQRPLTFVAKLKHGREWRWPIESMSTQTRNGVPTLVAELGREESDVPLRPPR